MVDLLQILYSKCSKIEQISLSCHFFSKESPNVVYGSKSSQSTTIYVYFYF